MVRASHTLGCCVSSNRYRDSLGSRPDALLSSEFPGTLGWAQKTSSSPSMAPQGWRSLIEGCGLNLLSSASQGQSISICHLSLGQVSTHSYSEALSNIPRSQLCSRDTGDLVVTLSVPSLLSRYNPLQPLPKQPASQGILPYPV